MSSNFTSLRSSRKTLLTKLAEEAKKEQAKGGGSNDERFWKLAVDAKTKIGVARLRFLPAPTGEDIPWVRLFSHAFEGPTGGWFIENCPTTLARKCPTCADNSLKWKTGLDKDKDIARKRKRKLTFISNILVIEDPAHPENNGKVFLFKYGAKIHAKIMELIEPDSPSEKPANPFDLWEGCDFKLKSKSVAGYQNYDSSAFDAPAELFGPDTDEQKEEIWAAEKSLREFVAEGQFKNYDELADRFQKVISGEGNVPRTAAEAMKAQLPTEVEVEKIVAKVEEEEKTLEQKEKAERKLPPRSAKKVDPPKVVVETPVVDGDNDEEIKAFFKNMQEDS